MAKDKPPKPKGIPNKHLHARITFLYQAATYLTLQLPTKNIKSEVKDAVSSEFNQIQESSPLAMQLGADLHTVSRKAQLRLSVDLKRSMCKSCHTVLVPGQTATQEIENKSKSGKKPWADVLVVNCNRCGSKRRMPVGTKRQPRKRDRLPAPANATSSDMEGMESTTPALHTATGQSPSSG
ncbi:Rpr2-domain-containing protein [Didymella exigua CBS 183.55]|uniref:Rpr2-domain-containing protein n=1 Tax=Didymella exigua CBS 183.55 TaxID=1150837 RepID=A0A6A5RS72_9PLEO|nr:Rpr2-domain-containing protein [Didymella exigua CBS 183.55]KAF1929166.1 Rpr2-domain-containing protein [Didymella exigua CBS 183.55]